MKTVKYTTEYLLDILRSEYQATGEVPKSSPGRNINASVFSGRFGSWKKALVAAGLPTTTTHKVTEKRLAFLQGQAAKSANRLNRPFEEMGWDSKRKRVIQEQNGKCNKCGIDEWRGVKLSLDVDHINGDRFDHRRENLEGLCPNCHSITPTYKGKNKLTKKNLVSDQQLIDALKSSKTIRQALISVGISPRGQNYRRAHELQLSIANSSGRVPPS